MPCDLSSVEMEIEIPGHGPYKLDLLESEVFLETFADGLKPQDYVPKVQQYLKDKTTVDVTYSQALKFVDFVRASFVEFKKKFGDELKSAFPLASTHFPSPSENTSSSETNSPE